MKLDIKKKGGRRSQFDQEEEIILKEEDEYGMKSVLKPDDQLQLTEQVQNSSKFTLKIGVKRGNHQSFDSYKPTCTAKYRSFQLQGMSVQTNTSS
ncbi:hypothetical protein FGIG_06836 [Fasciola gigantica]|uniref:Uncharacterized protein n=1 Tax=Fasciola gigantica TaxID=46835 RepID=A0A504ZAP1_FASGI|nr:hypothetical protein FGIG_06836 [Fasciola gigantica]